MLVKSLVNRLRTEFLDDAIAAVEDDYRWKTVEIVSALNAAHKELAKRLLLIEDSSTAAVCQLTIAAVDNVFPRTYNLDPRVLRIDRLLYPGVTKPLAPTTVSALDARDPGWYALDGTPSEYVPSVEGAVKRVAFDRRPTAAGTVEMTVRRLPLTDFSIAQIDTQETEMPGLEDELCHGALKQLYFKDDKKTFDPARGNKWSAAFEEDIRQIIRQQKTFSPRDVVMRPDRW